MKPSRRGGSQPGNQPGNDVSRPRRRRCQLNPRTKPPSGEAPPTRQRALIQPKNPTPAATRTEVEGPAAAVRKLTMAHGHVEGEIAKGNRCHRSVGGDNPSGPHAGDTLAPRQIINRHHPRHDQRITPARSDDHILSVIITEGLCCFLFSHNGTERSPRACGERPQRGGEAGFAYWRRREPAGHDGVRVAHERRSVGTD